MLPEFQTLEDCARRARAERALLIAEYVATAVIAIDRAIGTALNRAGAFLRALPALLRNTAPARR
jgi:hypothetical protein